MTLYRDGESGDYHTTSKYRFTNPESFDIFTLNRVRDSRRFLPFASQNDIETGDRLQTKESELFSDQ